MASRGRERSRAGSLPLRAMASYPPPVDDKHRLLLYKIEDSILQGEPYDEEKCGTCRFYVGIGDIAYCNHMKLRILVGERWWCQWWEPVEEEAAT